MIALLRSKRWVPYPGTVRNWLIRRSSGPLSPFGGEGWGEGAQARNSPLSLTLSPQAGRGDRIGAVRRDASAAGMAELLPFEPL